MKKLKSYDQIKKEALGDSNKESLNEKLGISSTPTPDRVQPKSESIQYKNSKDLFNRIRHADVKRYWNNKDYKKPTLKLNQLKTDVVLVPANNYGKTDIGNNVGRRLRADHPEIHRQFQRSCFKSYDTKPDGKPYPNNFTRVNSQWFSHVHGAQEGPTQPDHPFYAHVSNPYGTTTYMFAAINTNIDPKNNGFNPAEQYKNLKASFLNLKNRAKSKPIHSIAIPKYDDHVGLLTENQVKSAFNKTLGDTNIKPIYYDTDRTKNYKKNSQVHKEYAMHHRNKRTYNVNKYNYPHKDYKALGDYSLLHKKSIYIMGNKINNMKGREKLAHIVKQFPKLNISPIVDLSDANNTGHTAFSFITKDHQKPIGTVPVSLRTGESKYIFKKHPAMRKAAKWLENNNNGLLISTNPKGYRHLSVPSHNTVSTLKRSNALLITSAKMDSNGFINNPHQMEALYQAKRLHKPVFIVPENNTKAMNYTLKARYNAKPYSKKNMQELLGENPSNSNAKKIVKANTKLKASNKQIKLLKKKLNSLRHSSKSNPLSPLGKAYNKNQMKEIKAIPRDQYAPNQPKDPDRAQYYKDYRKLQLDEFKRKSHVKVLHYAVSHYLNSKYQQHYPSAHSKSLKQWSHYFDRDANLTKGYQSCDVALVRRYKNFAICLAGLSNQQHAKFNEHRKQEINDAIINNNKNHSIQGATRNLNDTFKRPYNNPEWSGSVWQHHFARKANVYSHQARNKQQSKVYQKASDMLGDMRAKDAEKRKSEGKGKGKGSGKSFSMPRSFGTGIVLPKKWREQMKQAQNSANKKGPNTPDGI